MSKEKDLLKRVRDTLHELKESHYDLYWDIQAALDQPEQEPVAWMAVNNNGGISIDSYYANHKDYVPLYLTPPKREPLSDEVFVVQETSSDDVEYVFEKLEDVEKYINQFDEEITGYRFRVVRAVVWRRGKNER